MGNPISEIFKRKSTNPITEIFSTTPGTVQQSTPLTYTGRSLEEQISPANLKQVALDNTQNPDNLLTQAALSATQSIAGMGGGIARTLGHVIPGLTGVADKIDQFVAGITPTQSGANPNLEALFQTVGTVAGETAANVYGFRGAATAARGAGNVLAKVAPEITTKALGAVSNAGRATELLVKQLNVPLIANDAARLGNAVIALPENVAAGLGLQAAIDPESLATPKGLAMGFGMSALGALMAAKGNTKSVDRLAKNIDTTLPVYEQNAQRVIQQNADVKVPDIYDAQQAFRTNFIDRLNPIKEFSNVVKGDNSIHDAVQLLANGSSSRISEMLNRGTVGKGFADLTNQTIGLKEILAPLANSEYEKGGALDRYLLARRVLDEGVQNKINENLNRPIPRQTVPLSVSDATQIVANAADHIKVAGDQITGYMNAVKEYGVKNGVINQEALNLLDSQNPNYIPLKREVERIIDPALKPIDNTFGPGKVIQKLFGSGRDVLSPIDNVRDFTTTVMRTADRNAIGHELLNATLENPIAAEAMGVRRITGADKFSNPEFYKQADRFKETLLNEHGVDITDRQAQQLIGQFGKNFDPNTNVLTVQTKEGMQRLQLNSQLAKTYQSLAPKQLNFLQNMLAIPARTLRTGTVAALDFSGVNLIRDSFDAALQSEHGFKWGQDNIVSLFPRLAESFKNTGRGFVSSIKKDQTFSDFRSAGGDYGDVARIGNRYGNVFEDVRPMTKGEVVKNVVMHPIDALKELTRPFEEAARLGEFISNQEHGATLQESALTARRVTTDFAQQGASMQALNQMTAFLNPAIQSLDRNYQVAMSNPVGLAGKGLALISIPSALLWWANKDDKEINDLRKTPAGATYWFVRTGDEVIRIPKPFLYGQVFGTTFEKGLDKAFSKDPQAVSSLMSSLVDQATFNIIPNGISIPLQMKLNKDIYTGGDIIPPSLKNVDPQTQVTLGTSQLAQHVSKYLYNASAGAINVSPIQLDWLAKNTGGNVAKDIISATGEKSEFADYPFLRRFIAKYPTMNVEPIHTFYDNFNKFSGVVKTVDKMATSSRSAEDINKFLEAHANEYTYAGIYAEAQKQLRDLQKTIWQVHTMPGMEEKEKQKYIKELTVSAIEIARGVNQAVQGQ